MLQSLSFTQAPFDKKLARGSQDVSAFWIFSEDGIRLRTSLWGSENEKSGTVFLFQGRTENLEKYGPTAEEIVRRGYRAFGIDWRGQGISDRLADDRMLGHVVQYSDYQKDVAAMLSAAETLELPQPWYLIGHSLGACIGLRALIDGLPITACAFTAPLWDINLSPFQRFGAWPLSWAAQITGNGQRYAPGTRGESYVLNTDFASNRLTSDPEMYQYYIDISEGLTHHQIGGPSMRWLYQTLRETRQLSRLSAPKVPCTTFCGALDDVVSLSAVKNRVAGWPDARFELVQNAKHDVLYEQPEIRKSVFRIIFDQFEGT